MYCRAQPTLPTLPGMDLETKGSPDLISKTNIVGLELAPFALRSQIGSSSRQLTPVPNPLHSSVTSPHPSMHTVSLNVQLCNESVMDGLGSTESTEIVQSPRLEKTSTIPKSNCNPSPTCPLTMSPSATSPWFRKTSEP